MDAVLVLLPSTPPLSPLLFINTTPIYPHHPNPPLLSFKPFNIFTHPQTPKITPKHPQSPPNTPNHSQTSPTTHNHLQTPLTTLTHHKTLKNTPNHPHSPQPPPQHPTTHSQFLEKDPLVRLGMPTSPHGKVRSHAFFNGVDWSLYEIRAVKPPFKPSTVRSFTSQSFFLLYFFFNFQYFIFKFLN